MYMTVLYTWDKYNVMSVVSLKINFKGENMTFLITAVEEAFKKVYLESNKRN